MARNHAELHRQPFLTPIWLTVLGAFVGVVVVGIAGWTLFTADSTTVVVIRHAEKQTGAGADPPLNQAGEARAQALARLFGDPGAVGRIDAIYVSPALRNRLTAAPLAARLGLTPIMASADDASGLARRVLREHRGGKALIIAHSDTVNEIVEALSGEPRLPAIADEEYGTMYIVSVPRIGHANVLRLNY